MTEPARQKRRPRWFQFSLHTLLMLMLAVAAYFAGFATSEKLAQKTIRDAQDKAAAEKANAQQAAVVAEQRAAAAAMTFQPPSFPVVTYPGLRVDVPSLGPMPIAVPYTYPPAYPMPVAPPGK